MEIRALESSLIRGMVEVLPEPGTVMEAGERVRWMDMMERALDLVYPAPSVPALPAPGPRAASVVAPVAPSAPVEVEARPRAPLGDPQFGKRFLEQKEARATSRKRREPVRPAGAVPPDARLDKPRARDMILAVLGEASGPLHLKAIVAEAEKKYKGHGFKNLYGAMGFQISRMDGKELEWVEGERGKEWAIK